MARRSVCTSTAFCCARSGNDAAMTVAERINLLASRSFMIQGCTLALSPVARANGAGVVPLLILILAFGRGASDRPSV